MSHWPLAIKMQRREGKEEKNAEEREHIHLLKEADYYRSLTIKMIVDSNYIMTVLLI